VGNMSGCPGCARVISAVGAASVLEGRGQYEWERY
jgi:hypothetical protein